MRPEGGHSMRDLTGQGEPSGFIQSVWGAPTCEGSPCCNLDCGAGWALGTSKQLCAGQQP